MKKKLLITILTLGLFSCKDESPEIIDITNLDVSEGFVDIPLSIVATKELDSYYEYTANAVLHKETVGIIVQLKKNIPAGFVNGEPKNMFLTDGIEFISLGSQSDKLFNFIAKKYDIPETNLVLKDSQLFTCANLNEEAINYKNGGGRFKIFLEGEEDYAELFVNFDFAKGIIALNEKDGEYREPLVKLMKK